MQLHMNNIPEGILVDIDGRIDATTANDFEETLMGKVGKHKIIILNCENLEYISSAGLRVLLVLAKKARETNHFISLANLQDDVLNVINITGFNTILNIYSDVDSALADAKKLIQ